MNEPEDNGERLMAETQDRFSEKKNDLGFERGQED